MIPKICCDIHSFWIQRQKRYAFLSFAIPFITVVAVASFLKGQFWFPGDDLVQYRTFMLDIFRRIKVGDFSFYSPNYYYGQNMLSNVYYFPLDIFTLIAFVLDYIPNFFDWGISISEAIKLGLIGLAFFFLLNRYKINGLYAFIGAIAFVIFGNNYFIMYPVFTSGLLYMCITVFLLDYVRHSPWRMYLLTLWCGAMCFWNIYLAYVCIACSLLFYLVLSIIGFPNEKINSKRIFKACGFYALACLFLLFGPFLSASVNYPFLKYIAASATGARYGTITFSSLLISRTAMLAGCIIPLGSNCVLYDFSQNSYIFSQGSVFITLTFMLFGMNVFTRSDHISNRKKIIILCELPFLFIPILCNIFNFFIAPYMRFLYVFNAFNILLGAEEMQNEGHIVIFQGKNKKRWLSCVMFLYILDAVYFMVCNFNPFVIVPCVYIFITALLYSIEQKGAKKSSYIKAISIELIIGAGFFLSSPVSSYAVYYQNFNAVSQLTQEADLPDTSYRKSVFYCRGYDTAINIGPSSGQNIIGNESFHSFMNKNSAEYLRLFSESNTNEWTKEGLCDNFLSAAATGVEYTLVKSGDGLPDMQDSPFYEYLGTVSYGSSSCLKYKNVYSLPFVSVMDDPILTDEPVSEDSNASFISNYLSLLDCNRVYKDGLPMTLYDKCTPYLIGSSFISDLPRFDSYTKCQIDVSLPADSSKVYFLLHSERDWNWVDWLVLNYEDGTSSRTFGRSFMADKPIKSIEIGGILSSKNRFMPARLCSVPKDDIVNLLSLQQQHSDDFNIGFDDKIDRFSIAKQKDSSVQKIVLPLTYDDNFVGSADYVSFHGFMSFKVGTMSRQGQQNISYYIADFVTGSHLFEASAIVISSVAAVSETVIILRKKKRHDGAENI